MQPYFKSIFCKPTELSLAFYRHVSGNSKNKHTVGQIVKRLNKENKALFGNLLESRGERRKSLTNISHKPKDVDDLVNQVLPSEESELNKIKVCRHSSAQTNWSRVGGDDVHSNCGINTKKSETHNSPDASFNVMVKPPQANTSTVILPPVVLKSIKGFPLINQNKSVSSSYSLEPSETLISRNKEYSKLYPSVGKILNATMPDLSKILLKKWREKMILDLGEEGFLKFYKAQLNSGIQFHAAVQSFLRGASKESLVLDGQGVAGCWKSLSSVISEVNGVQVLEGPVCHSHLFYHGVLDCIASYQGEEVMIEWKKSDKPKPTLEKTYDAPVQLSAYIGAMNYDLNYPVQVNGGLVVIAYSDGSPADVFHLTLSECNKYWKSWLERVRMFWFLQQEGEKLTPKSRDKELQ